MEREEFKEALKDAAFLMRALLTLFPNGIGPDEVAWVEKLQDDKVGLDALRSTVRLVTGKQ